MAPLAPVRCGIFSTLRRLGQIAFLNIHGEDFTGIPEIVIGFEPGRVDTRDGADIVHLVDVARDPGRADDLARGDVVDELAAAFEGIYSIVALPRHAAVENCKATMAPLSPMMIGEPISQYDDTRATVQ